MKIKKIFLTGLTAVVPFVITIYIVIGLFRFADSILEKFINRYLEIYLGYEIPGLGIILSIAIIFLLGLLIHVSRMRLLRGIEALFLKIPLVSKIYLPTKRMIEFLFFDPKKNFRAVILVEYPRKGIYSIGFVTNDSDKILEEGTGKKAYNVFIPSSPSPLTGFTIIVPREEVILINIGVEEAIRLVVSGGVINPQEFIK
ncbi:MAG: DUF502 domain-containing protein [Candidatus Omnitrophica bacterium]|nr:DUF502 domain-containing protein [Candidatus Omnitrophota bacterium]